LSVPSAGIGGGGERGEVGDSSSPSIACVSLMERAWAKDWM